MQKSKPVHRLAVIAIFLVGFLIGGCYIRYIDVTYNYNSEMIQDSIIRLERVQQKYEHRFGNGAIVRSSAVVSEPEIGIMIQP